jgi:plastocyanin
MRRSAALAMIALLAILAPACGGDDNPAIEGTPTTTAPTTPELTDEPTVACDDQSGAAEARLAIEDENALAFEPECLTVDRSAALVITNNGDLLHSFTVSGTDVDVDVKGGEQERLDAPSPLDPGEYQFFCTYHPAMTGTITVNDA